jgi:hypothetical protein
MADHPATRRLLHLAVAAVFAFAVAACGDDDDDDSGGGGATTDGGGGMQAGAPQFLSFEASSSVPCRDGNATVTMSYTTENVADSPRQDVEITG